MIRRLLGAGVLAAALLVPVVPASEAHSGGSFCEGIFTPTAYGPVRPDGTRLGAGSGQCVTTFQGFPVGVIGVYETGDATAPAEIHVEVWGVTPNGTKYKMAECESAGSGSTSCEFEKSEIGRSLTLAEPLPQQIVKMECSGHSHANIKPQTTPVARFGCYTTDEAEAELRDDMGLPPSPPTESESVPFDAVVTAVPKDTYVPRDVLVSRDGTLTFANEDANQHDVVARVYDDAYQPRADHIRPDDSAPWCEDYYEDCPLFWSELVFGPGVTTPVLGLEDTEVGETYEFFCTIHPYMTGTISVVA